LTNLTKIEQRKHIIEINDTDDVVMRTIEPFICPICFENYDAGEGVILQACFHTFCFECIKSHIMHDTKIKTQCPYMDFNYTCKQMLLVRKVSIIFVLENIFFPFL
jgi:hypothetical protein